MQCVIGKTVDALSLIVCREKDQLGRKLHLAWLIVWGFSLTDSRILAQSLDEQLRRQPPKQLAESAKREGDAVRGAIVFFQHHMACSKCHSVGLEITSALGPDLAKIGKDVSDESLVESVLLPSKVIRKGFESVTVLMSDGTSRSGILVETTPDEITFRDLARAGEKTTLRMSEIDEVKMNSLSIMPAAQVNQLASPQQFLDLIRYLIEIRDGGPLRARALQPAPTLLTLSLPEYEGHLDHAGLISEWDSETLKRGEAIYRRVCMNCHGTREQPGSLPTSLRFAEGKFKNGSDPWAMYQTLTRGFGLMVPQTWMVPSQKYDVIHYIRETYLRPHNPSQFVAIDEAYLARLPKGDTRGPQPSKIEPWSAMDYGPTLTHTYEVPGRQRNLAYKGIAIRLDPGAGGISRGHDWTIFDTDTLRVAAVSSADEQAMGTDNFIDWRGIQFNGEHQIHPSLTGRIVYSNSNAPGWANPSTGEFLDDLRTEGRDGRRYGPLPRRWGRFRGMYHFEQQAILSYTVGTTEILESPRFVLPDDTVKAPVFLRTLNIGPRDHDLLLQVAEDSNDADGLVVNLQTDKSSVIFPAAENVKDPLGSLKNRPLKFDGSTHLEIRGAERFDLTATDWTMTARLKTTAGGTIFALANTGPKWTPDGQSLFIRDGHLCFDIGWVGVISTVGKVNDGKWHIVTATWQKSDHRLRLYIDGQLDREGQLAAKGSLEKPVVRIGFGAPDFPQPETFFQGEVSEVRFYQRRLSDGLKEFTEPKADDKSLMGRWLFDQSAGDVVSDTTDYRHDADVKRTDPTPMSKTKSMRYGIAPAETPASWITQQGRLCLKIPAGSDAIKFSIWTADQDGSAIATKAGQEHPDKRSRPLVTPPFIQEADRDLSLLTRGGPPRWSQRLETQAQIGADQGPFAVDLLTAPETNPWLAQLRFTGLDFFADGRIALCDWDGDVWIVEMINSSLVAGNSETPRTMKLRWQRVATGLFQPLGLKIVDDLIHVICRDQLAVLHDLNGDGEIDFYECLNSDHQVTEHFHEFAMGLQTDAQGNFYYAKSGRHALPAVVPHHGTLLKISKDGSKTEILATGFRAANGVCLNPDGSFVVTDQEGFWNPKNRINWVTLDPSGKPRFYGNMFGYHDVTDASDGAMEPPLCWITNDFDRSPAELLWVKGAAWGPLQGSLLNLSYGYGKVYVVPHEKIEDVMQGGMIELPIPPFPTGVMRGRFHPSDGQLYLCGMFAWAGSATHPGGVYRLRATGRPMHLPIGLQAKKSGLTLTFTEPLDPDSIDPSMIQIKTWSLKRTANYGSKHYDEKQLAVQRASLSADGLQLTLKVAEIQPTWCMEILYSLRSRDGQPFSGKIHNTIHRLGD